MRILAIRGQNLASIPGPFEVDLANGALGHAGLFAIVGPTGAGKSTLLDALCLALFDETPRLADASRDARVGRADDEEKSRLRGNDVRGVLRRGAGAGWAEVDFRGGDGRRYRARWSVRRARGKATGRFQAQEMWLEDIESGERFGDKKTEVIKFIADSQRLGLDFKQFRRSVLLAQGDFAAFLKVKGSERAKLLEQMTDGALYGELSVAAHERAGEERKALETLQAQADGAQPLDADARAALEAAAADCGGEVERLTALRDEARAHLRWYEELTRREDELKAAERALADAEAVWETTSGERDELRRVEDAQTIRTPLEAFDGAGRRAAEAARAAESAAAHAVVAAREAQEAALLREADQTRLGEAETALREEGPALKAARALDGRIDLAAEEHRRAGEAAGQAQKELTRAEEARRQADEAVGSLEAARDEAKRWLESHPQVAPLAEEWPRWQAELGRFAQASERRRTAEHAAATVEKRISDARDAEATAGAALTAAVDLLTAAERAVAAAEAAASELDAAAANERAAHAQGRVGLLTRAASLTAECAQAVARRNGYAEREERASQKKAGALQLAERAEATRAGLAQRAAEAERALEMARTAAGLGDHRAALRPGEPCPLCGSPDHPWAEDAPLASLVDEHQARVQQLRAELQAEADRAARAQAEAAAAERARAEAAADRLRASTDVDRYRAAWTPLRQEAPELPLPEAPDAPGAEASVAALGTAAESAWAAARADVEKAGKLAASAARARTAREEARTRCAQAGSAHQDAEATLRAASEERRNLDGAIEEARRGQADALTALVPAFVQSGRPWQDHLAADPIKFGRNCARAVEEWQRKRTAREEAEEALSDTRSRAAAARAALEGARSRAGETGGALQGRVDALGTLRTERGELLDGAPVDAVERKLEDAVAGARQALDVSERTAREALKATTAAETRAKTARETAAANANERDRAREELDGALARAEVDEPTLRQRLGRGDEWLRAQRERHAALSDAREKARTVRDERVRRRNAHRQDEGRPERPREEAAQAAETLVEELSAADGRRAEQLGLLKADDTARVRLADLKPVLDRQQARCDLWGQLSGLIGSHDGKKFRDFAQSLTLEALLVYANEHLSELAARYVLARVPGSDLEIQIVDRYAGDEVRSVSSLSGGETFLVSLALALGLSSMTATRTRIESLFIDEGFGTLDPATLDTALGVLDTLQASGRQIGLISHVPRLEERAGARVVVAPTGAGASRIEVVA